MSHLRFWHACCSVLMVLQCYGMMQRRQGVRDGAVEMQMHRQFKEAIIFTLQGLWECWANYPKLSSFKLVKSCRYPGMICSHWAPWIINVSLKHIASHTFREDTLLSTESQRNFVFKSFCSYVYLNLFISTQELIYFKASMKH